MSDAIRIGREQGRVRRFVGQYFNARFLAYLFKTRYLYWYLDRALEGEFIRDYDDLELGFLGTTDDDMRVLSEVTSHVHGVDEDKTTRDPGPYTARGVVAAMRATLKALFGSDSVAGRSILIQGVGGVGEPLAATPPPGFPEELPPIVESVMETEPPEEYTPPP